MKTFQVPIWLAEKSACLPAMTAVSNPSPPWIELRPLSSVTTSSPAPVATLKSAPPVSTIGFGPGGANDAWARALRDLGRPVVNVCGVLPRLEFPRVGLDDAAIGRLAAGINNATDELYPVAGNSSLTTGSGYAEVAYARPREWFATFQYDF